MDTVSYLLGKKNGGGSGTTNYNDLSNKPSINNVSLSGNKTSSDLGIQEELVSGINIKTINNQSILGSGDITISGGGNLPLFYSVTDRFDFDVSNDVEPGIYISKNQRFMLYIKALEGTTWNSNGYFGFFIVLKKYSEAQVNEPFIVMLTEYGYIKQWIKTNNNYGISTISVSGTIDWVSQQQVLTLTNNNSYTPSSDYNPATKKYVDGKPTTYAGYDATKTQVLKNINGTLTWVDE